MFKKIQLIVVVSALLIGNSCKKSSDTPVVPNPNISFSATINGASEVPANASTATGSATGTFNTTTKVFTLTVTYTGVTASASHIHKAAAGASGGVVFGFTPFTSPINFSATLDATQEADLMANLYYVNIHSAAFGAGEIRGQLIKQ
ncbi:CHRD domain-containing protein [Ferruginibacter sp.]|nr:CHRD domain-containing protein [Ferruginibacter sp.]